MPAAALVGRTIFCVHGGLCPELRELKDAYAIARPSQVNPQGLCSLAFGLAGVVPACSFLSPIERAPDPELRSC